MSSQLEILKNRFNVLLTQYQDTYKEFIDYLNNNQQDNSFKLIPRTAFISSENISSIGDTTIDNCLTLCNSNTLCSGATFDNYSNSCILSKGKGDISNSTSQTSIVKQSLYYSHQLKDLNDQLIKINQSISKLIGENESVRNSVQKENEEKSKQLDNTYKILNEEKIQIEKMINQYKTLNSAYENGSINLTSNYYKYILFLLIAVMLIYYIFKYSIPNQQFGGKKIISGYGNSILTKFLRILHLE